jgi:hypothetical protein
MIGRLLVEGRDDLPAVHALQDGMRLRPLEGAGAPARRRFDGGFTGEALRDTAPSGARFAQVVNAVLAQNPPPEREREMVAAFAACGIGAGLEPGPAQGDLLDAALAAELLTWHHSEFGGTGPTGWQTPPLQGESFGDDYVHRAHVALKYIGVLDSREAMYLMLHADAQGRALHGDQRRTLHFPPAGLPPVEAFWSLTLYDADSCMLVDNPIGRYAIGDRTPGLKTNADGSLDIWIGHEDPGPERQANWLPAPAGPFALFMRAYLPKPDLLDGRYRLPPVEAA